MRKVILTYTFFAIYLLAMIKPMLPILDYYANYEYIATQLCENRDKPILDCNGKCYVAKEIEKDKKTNHQDTTVPEFKIDIYLANTFEIDIITSNFTSLIKRSKPIFKNSFTTDELLYTIFHPPRAIA